jgi:hypothetical protein
MAVEDQVRDLLQELTPYPPLGLDGAVVARSAQRRHRRRVALVTLPAVVVVVALVLGGTALLGRSGQPRSELPAGPGAGWHRIPDLPLSPRSAPLVAWTGDEALVIGGVGTTDGPGLRDGGAYDPEARTWRTISPAPVSLSASPDDASMVADGTLFVAHHGDLLAYDIAADTWRRLPAPPQDVYLATIAAQDGLLYLLGENAPGETDIPVQVLDLATGSWSTLPPDPELSDRYLRTLVATPTGLVVMGDGLDRASADVWDGTSWEHHDTDLRGAFWTWTGERIVPGYLASHLAATPSGAFDPATGTWTALPRLPVDSPTTLWDGDTVATDGPQVFSNSTVYDDADGSFTNIQPPEPGLTSPGLALVRGTLLTFGGHTDTKGAERPTTHAWAYDLP